MIDKSNALPEETRFDLAAMNGYVDSFSRASASCLRHERSNAKKLYELLPDDKLLTKESLDRCRQAILESNLSINTVYSFATTVNKICRYLNRPDLCYERTKKNDLAGKRFGELRQTAPRIEEIDEVEFDKIARDDGPLTVRPEVERRAQHDAFLVANGIDAERTPYPERT